MNSEIYLFILLEPFWVTYGSRSWFWCRFNICFGVWHVQLTYKSSTKAAVSDTFWQASFVYVTAYNQLPCLQWICCCLILFSLMCGVLLSAAADLSLFIYRSFNHVIVFIPSSFNCVIRFCLKLFLVSSTFFSDLGCGVQLKSMFHSWWRIRTLANHFSWAQDVPHSQVSLSSLTQGSVARRKILGGRSGDMFFYGERKLSCYMKMFSL